MQKAFFYVYLEKTKLTTVPIATFARMLLFEI